MYAHFSASARDADDLLRALDLRDLARGGTGRARRAGDDDHVALLHLPHVDHAEVGRHPGDAQDPDGGRRRHALRQHLHRALAGVGDHVVLPAGHAEQQLAGLVGVGAAVDDLADPAAADDLVELDRRQIARNVVHPGADRRVDRQIANLDQRLAILEVGHLFGLQAGRAPVHQAGGSLRQHQTSILLAHTGDLMATVVRRSSR